MPYCLNFKGFGIEVFNICLDFLELKTRKTNIQIYTIKYNDAARRSTTHKMVDRQLYLNYLTTRAHHNLTSLPARLEIQSVYRPQTTMLSLRSRGKA